MRKGGRSDRNRKEKGGYRKEWRRRSKKDWGTVKEKGRKEEMRRKEKE